MRLRLRHLGQPYRSVRRLCLDGLGAGEGVEAWSCVAAGERLVVGLERPRDLTGNDRRTDAIIAGLAGVGLAVTGGSGPDSRIGFGFAGDYELVLPLMLAAGLATFLAERLRSESVYSLPLRKRGIVYAESEDIDIMQVVRVGEVMTVDPDATERYAEIEALLSDYATPIFRAAALGSQNINMHIVNDKSFNAFVIDGQNMFIHVGAMTKSETPNQLIGVIAHEAGHIAGGHLARLKVQISRMQSAALIMNLIGIGAMIGGAVSGEDGGGSGPDAPIGSAGLVLEFRGVPTLPASLGGDFDAELEEVRLDLENVRAVGDAAPGDERVVPVHGPECRADRDVVV